MRRLLAYGQSRLLDERGASMVEYSILVALIAIVAVVAVIVLGGAVSESYQSTADTWPP
jgi:pilus assembly protein Flp/PilA